MSFFHLEFFPSDIKSDTYTWSYIFSLKKKNVPSCPATLLTICFRGRSLHTLTPSSSSSSSSPLGAWSDHCILSTLWCCTRGGGGGENIGPFTAVAWKPCLDLSSHQPLLVELPSAKLKPLLLEWTKHWCGSATRSPSHCKLTCTGDTSCRI